MIADDALHMMVRLNTTELVQEEVGAVVGAHMIAVLAQVGELRSSAVGEQLEEVHHLRSLLRRHRSLHCYHPSHKSCNRLLHRLHSRRRYFRLHILLRMEPGVGVAEVVGHIRLRILHHHRRLLRNRTAKEVVGEVRNLPRILRLHHRRRHIHMTVVEAGEDMVEDKVVGTEVDTLELEVDKVVGMAVGTVVGMVVEVVDMVVEVVDSSSILRRLLLRLPYRQRGIHL